MWEEDRQVRDGRAEAGGRESRPVHEVTGSDVEVEGERVAEAPDIIVGYNYGYGNSDEASTGQITHDVLAENDMGGTFNGSHLMSPDVVKGILMTNGKVLPGDHQLEDLTVQVLSHYGIEPTTEMKGHPVLQK